MCLKRERVAFTKKSNKKGFSILEIVAAIFIIGLATSTLTSAIMSSYSAVAKAGSYVVANEVSQTYSVFTSNEITKEMIATKEKDYIVIICDRGNEDAKSACAALLGTASFTYKALYENVSTLSLNGYAYNASRIKMEIEVKNNTYGIYKLTTTVFYSNREVSYAHTFYCNK